MDRFGEQMNSILTQVYRSVHEVESASLKSITGNSMTIGEMHTLECIANGGEQGRSVTDIAQEMGVALASATMAIKKLESKGYAVKEKNAQDGRRVTVKLTEAGRRMNIGHRYFHRQMARAMEKAVPEEERAVLIKGLHSIDEFLTGKARELNGGKSRTEHKGVDGE